MAASNVSANNHANGPQILNTGGGPQNNNNDKGLQINNSSFYGFSLSDLKPDKAILLQQEKQDCLRSLSFEYMDARKEDISLAHHHTCDWLFETSQFQQWHRCDYLQNHNGVLWIKGHLGTGKSTLMKHTLRHLEENFSGTHVIAAHFFNARGDYSEQTPLFMLRSLLYQMLEKEPSIYELFVPLFRDKKQKHDNGWKWRDTDLKNFLLSNIKRFQSKPLFVLVDALDECEETHVRDVVGLLETLSDKATNAGVTLNICLSSRHYPHIGMRKHLELVVEQISEHDEDIFIYTRDNLAINDKGIEKELLEKASGIFMWVVLVIKLLNEAYDEGKIEAMHETLHEVPRDLEIVFEKLLITDNRHKHETVFMLQFVLAARRLITPEELYFATLAKAGENIEAWDQSRVTPDDIRRRIANSSRGLIEIRTGEVNSVQFIHKSVNDFLIRNKRLQRLDPDLGINALGSSHECLRSCCMRYLMMEMFQSATDRKQVKALGRSYPFLEYAFVYILAHAEEADRQQVRQTGFLQRLLEEAETLEKLRLLHNTFEEYPGSGCAKGVNLLHMLAFHGYTRLTKALLDKKVINPNAQGGVYFYALQAAAAYDNKEIIDLLLEHGADVNAQGGSYGNAFYAATLEGRANAVQMLHENGADVDFKMEIYEKVLQAAMVEGHKKIMQLLIEKGANINPPESYFHPGLQATTTPRTERQVLEIILSQGVQASTDTRRVIHVFINKMLPVIYEETMEILLKEDITANNQWIYDMFCWYVMDTKTADSAVRLVEKGANPNPYLEGYSIGLAAAMEKGTEEVLAALLDNEADINAPMFYTEVEAGVQEPKSHTSQHLARLVLGMLSTLLLVLWVYSSEILWYIR